jgi:hypothetical protein
VPGDRDVPCGLVQCDAREKLAICGRIIVDLNRVAPGCSVIIGEPHEDIGIIALVHRFFGINEVHSAVVWATAAVVGQTRLRVHRAVWLRWDKVEPTDIGGCGSKGLLPAAPCLLS